MKKLIFILPLLLVAPLAHAANQYSYVQDVRTADGGFQTISGGPFSSVDACYADMNSRGAALNNGKFLVANGSGECTCGTPVSQQPACPGYDTPPATGGIGSCGPSNGGDYSCPSGQTCRVSGNVGSCVSLDTGTSSAAPTAPSGGNSVPVSGSTGGTPGTFVPLVTIPNLTDMPPSQEGLAGFLNNLYKYLIGLAAILAVVEIIYGGLQIATQDSVSKHGEGKQRIYNALFGLLLVLSPAVVFGIINPGILNLSVNIPKLDLSAPPAPAAQAPYDPCADPSLSADQKQACQTTQSAKQTGLVNLTPDQRKSLEQSIPILQQTIADQTKACTAKGGSVYSGATFANGCSPGVVNLMQRFNYGKTCTAMQGGSVCFSP